jgi:hypothetical protein
MNLPAHHAERPKSAARKGFSRCGTNQRLALEVFPASL